MQLPHYICNLLYQSVIDHDDALDGVKCLRIPDTLEKEVPEVRQHSTL
jgi:hypothetical protein